MPLFNWLRIISRWVDYAHEHCLPVHRVAWHSQKLLIGVDSEHQQQPQVFVTPPPERLEIGKVVLLSKVYMNIQPYTSRTLLISAFSTLTVVPCDTKCLRLVQTNHH